MTDLQPAPSTTPTPRRRRWAFLATPGWISAVAAALLFALACFTVLAPWQLDRHTDRARQNAAVTAAAAAPAVPVRELLSPTGPPSPEAVWHLVTATGTYLPEATVTVRLRQDAKGSPASEVVVPLRLDDGTLLMVDRGYVPSDAVGSTPPVPSGRVTVVGRVQPDQVDPRNRLPVVQDGLLQAWAVNGPQLMAATGLSGPALGGFIQLVEGAPGVLDPIGVPQIDSGPFLSYALQWVAFGVIAVIGMGVFVYREAVDPRDDRDDGDDRGGDDRADLGEDGPPTVDHRPTRSIDGDPNGDRAGPPVRDDLGAGLPPGGPSDPPRAAGRRRRRGFDRSQLYDSPLHDG